MPISGPNSTSTTTPCFVVLKPARYVDPVEVIELGEILLFVDQRFVVAVRHGEASKLVEVRKAARERSRRVGDGPERRLAGNPRPGG